MHEKNCYHVAVLIFGPSTLYLSNCDVIHYFIDYIYSSYQCLLHFSFTHVNIVQVIMFIAVMNANIPQQRGGIQLMYTITIPEKCNFV
jgi:hypothetical protein